MSGSVNDAGASGQGRPAAVKNKAEQHKTDKHKTGHRQRLRARFLSGGPEALADYEVLELLLFAAIRQGDVKPLAKRLIGELGGLGGVLSATPEVLRAAGLGDASIAAIRIVQAAALHLIRSDLKEQPLLSSWQALLDYLQAGMAREPREQFRVLFLDRKNRLIADEIQQQGTVDQAAVYPREVLRRSLELSASALILVHNHPSGDPTPSKADIAVTKQVIAAAEPLGIVVHDHIVVGRGKHASFRALGLI